MKINYKKNLFKGKSGLCESIFCAPFESPEKFEEEDFENNRFSNLMRSGNQIIEYVGIEDCDYVILPYKWDSYSKTTQCVINEAKKLKKKVIVLHNDDYQPSIKIKEDDGFIFTTTITRGHNQKNEFPFPAFTGDFFSSEFNLTRRFGFCGAITHGLRNQIISMINRSELEKDFVIRKGFWAPELTKTEARYQYVKHIENNAFTICIRGAGNFSYRLYETMMMGRIPVIIDTDQILPFERHLDYSEFSLRINYRDDKIIDKLGEFVLKSDEDIISMQKKSRLIWKEYMSPEGWIKNFEKELC